MHIMLRWMLRSTVLLVRRLAAGFSCVLVLALGLTLANGAASLLVPSAEQLQIAHAFRGDDPGFVRARSALAHHPAKPWCAQQSQPGKLARVVCAHEAWLPIEVTLGLMQWLQHAATWLVLSYWPWGCLCWCLRAAFGHTHRWAVKRRTQAFAQQMAQYPYYAVTDYAMKAAKP